MEDTAPTNSATIDTATDTGSPSAVSDTAPADTGLPAEAVDTGTDAGVEQTDTPPLAGDAAPMDAAAARSFGLIAEHFGLTADVARNLPPNVLQSLAATAEQALIDRFITGQAVDRAPQPGANMPEQPGQVSPAIKIDFKPFLSQIEAEYDKPLAEQMGGALNAVVEAFNKQLAPLAAMQQAFAPIAESWQQHEVSRQQALVDQFFTDLIKTEPVWKDRYSGPAAAKAQTAVIQLAGQLRTAAAQAGQDLTPQQALKRAHLALSREVTQQQATDAVRQQVQKRSRQITTPPNHAVSAGRPGSQPKSLRDRLIAEITPQYNALKEAGALN